jgi:hypothetical protein
MNMTTAISSDKADHVALSGDWALWPDFAVRSTGFDIDGLEVFGAPDEEARLTALAGEARFRDAVAWQSREALRSAVNKLAAGGESESRRRRREEVVASYWQRYCAKNDTIGFFGPLGWGRFDDREETVQLRSGAADARRVLHLETWAAEAVGRALGEPAALRMSPFPERELRARLSEDPHALAELERIEAARAGLTTASGDELVSGLDELDRIFAEVTGRPPLRTDSDTGGGRTVAYLDCDRDLDLTLGKPILDELRLVLPAVLAASRWWCGRVFARGTKALAAVAEGRDGPLGPLMGELMEAGWGLHAELDDDQRELQDRWAATVDGDLEDLAERAATEFADWQPAWAWSAYHSVDIQLAARDIDALREGDFLVVLGDLHPGANPLMQGLFANRTPIAGMFEERVSRELGPRIELLPPRRGPVEMSARLFPVYGKGDTVVVVPGEPEPVGTRAIDMRDLAVEGGAVLDRAGTFRVELAQLLCLPIFVSAIRTFELVGVEVTDRVTLGRTVIRRASWSMPARELTSAEAIEDWASSRELPRRVFARSPLERKPRFVDFESPVLCRTLARWATATAAAAPTAEIEFSEMLPEAEDCWLEDDFGRHSSELRVVAVDSTQLQR